MGKLFKKPGQRGWTIIELMMVVAIVGLITPALLILFSYCYQGMAAAEMHLSLKAMNEQIMLHLHERMNSNKHMFQNDTTSGGLNFLPQIQFGSAPLPAPITLLPEKQSGTTITFSPKAGAVASEYGNCLFYAAADTPQTINGKVYTAPVTVTGVTDGSGKLVTLNLDVYRFYFDYLSTAGALKKIPTMTSYWLIEWQSVQFVDAFELNDIFAADPTLGPNVVTWLTTGANFASGQPLTLAWDPSQTQMAAAATVTAFYTLSGSAMSTSPNQSILAQNYTPLSCTNSGLISPFNYGISGNYSNLAGDPPPPNVPMYAAAPSTLATAFPGGFEVGLEGASGGMQVLIRSLLIAKGNSKGIIWDNETSVSSARDVW
jgi:prepilin-type N-terminal cleavage/methylation domain-containing protein